MNRRPPRATRTATLCPCTTLFRSDLKYFDGSVQQIDRIPAELKDIYKCAFEIDAKRLVDAGSRRQKWIDQAQSLNLYMAQPSGKKLDELNKRSEEHTSELQSLMRISYAVFCLNKKRQQEKQKHKVASVSNWGTWCVTDNETVT